MSIKPAPRFSTGQLVVSHRGEPAVVRKVIPVPDLGKSHRVQVSWLLPGNGSQLIVSGAIDRVAYYEHAFEAVEMNNPGWWDFVVGPFVVRTRDGYVGVDDNGDVNGKATRQQAFEYMLLVDACDIAMTFVDGNVLIIGAEDQGEACGCACHFDLDGGGVLVDTTPDHGPGRMSPCCDCWTVIDCMPRSE